ncbi:NADH-quinone oxidoreductase subunit NuoN [Longivirga aurantiaca]|uniref:NADH-quinone oxidoreductase subunit N n=1 Tax=Longivirga aurantiaca TaxID=1837743 RepID=A0ABW1SZ93_9ACTN
MSAILAATGSFEVPTIEYAALAPILMVLGGAVVSVLLEAFLPQRLRRPVQLTLTFATLVAAFVFVVLARGTRAIVAEGSVAVDGPTLFMQGSILVLAFIAALVMAERQVDPAGDAFAPRASALPGSEEEQEFTRLGWFQTEVWPLFLFSVGGMLLFPASTDLLTMFVALEVLSLPLYVLAGLARRRRLLSQEASLKYFVLGAFSSAFFLYGTALLYGFAGTVELRGIANALTASAGQSGLVIAGTALLMVGLLFKIGAAPFHQWTPDVYQGSPTSITGFMAACTKVAAFGALLRVMYVALGGIRWDWRPVMYVIAALTMIVGTIFALTQTDIKRMLAYSSVAQAGFMLVGVLATSAAGLAGTMVYLLAYGVATVGAFAIITLVRDATGEATHLSSWAGLGKKSPLVASAFALFLLAFAGIPLTSGFTGKFAVFTAGIAGGATPVVIVGVVASAVAAFFYIRVIVLMFFNEPPADGGASVVIPSSFTTFAITITVAITLVIGVLPQIVLQLVDQAGVFVR